MRLALLPVHQNPGTLPKIHLQLLARSAFYPAKGRLRPERQSAHEAFDRIIPTGKRVPGDQVLIDALSRKPRQQTLLDHSGQRGTLAGPPRIGPGGAHWPVLYRKGSLSRWADWLVLTSRLSAANGGPRFRDAHPVRGRFCVPTSLWRPT